MGNGLKLILKGKNINGTLLPSDRCLCCVCFFFSSYFLGHCCGGHCSSGCYFLSVFIFMNVIRFVHLLGLFTNPVILQTVTFNFS